MLVGVYVLSSLLCWVAALLMMARFNSASAGYAESYLLITILGLQHVAHDVRDVDLAGNAGDWSPGQQDKHDTAVQFPVDVDPHFPVTKQCIAKSWHRPWAKVQGAEC